MENAAKLLGQKANQLRKRLDTAKGELEKISKCGDEMEGNTSHNEEEEFIDALKEEMPEVFKNIESNYEQLDKIDDLIQAVLKDRQIETMQELKGQIDDAQTKVEQCEGLVNKLENEIIEWDAHKKLCRRDEELGEIESLLKEFK
jgi:predicted nuclease with TOPRIM domain